MLDQTAAVVVVPTWTAERILLLQGLHKQGYTATQIANELGGVSRNAVCGKIDRLGLTGRARVKKIKQARNFLTREEKAQRQQDRHTIKVLAIRKAHANGMLKAEMVDAIEPEEPSEAPVGFLGISFMQLEDGLCKFPRGEGASISFCGQAAIKEQPYCRSCHSLCYSPYPRRDASPAPANYAAPGTAWV